MRALLISSAVAWLTCCSYDPSVKPEEVCDEIAATVAHQTLACTGDDELANDRFERINDEYRCDESAFADACAQFDNQNDCGNARCVWRDEECVGGAVVSGEFAFGCAQGIGALTCSQVVDYGDDLSLWLAVRPSCSILVEEGGR